MKLEYKTSFIICAFILVLSACKSEPEKPQEIAEVKDNFTVVLTPTQAKNAEIIVGKINDEFGGQSLHLNGMIEVEPSRNVAVSSPLGGYVQNIDLIPGTRVGKGRRIASIKNPEFIKIQEEYLTAKAKMQYARQDVTRQRELNKDKAGSDKVLQQAESDFQVQQALVQSLARQLQTININPGSVSARNISATTGVFAPISGVVNMVHVKPGQYINPTEALVEITDPNARHLTLRVFEKDLNRIKPGQAIVAYTNNYPDLKYEGNIDLVNPVLDDSRSAEIHAHLRNMDKSLTPGTYMNALVQLDPVQNTTLPEDATVTWEGKQYAFVATGNNSYTMTEIVLGNRIGTNFEIKNADSLHNKNVVMKGAYTLLMALKNVSEDE